MGQSSGLTALFFAAHESFPVLDQEGTESRFTNKVVKRWADGNCSCQHDGNDDVFFHSVRINQVAEPIAE